MSNSVVKASQVILSLLFACTVRVQKEHSGHSLNES